MVESLPKEKLLLKLLMMTSSSNDGEALTAVRKANDLLSAAGWSWEKLLAAKITIVGDPFAGVSAPPSSQGRTDSSASAPHRAPSAPPPPPQRASPPPRAKAPPPPQRPRAPSHLSTKTNLYPGYCYCCGDHVDAAAGMVFNPSTYNSRAKDRWNIVCLPCNSSVASYAVRNTAAKANPKPAPPPGPAPLSAL